jgi:hypothetical protein
MKKFLKSTAICFKQIFYDKKICFLLLMLFLLNGYLSAQQYPFPVGPFSYDPPRGTQRYATTQTGSEIKISMSYVSALSSNEDCMMVEFDINLNENSDENKRIALFMYDTDSILNIKYSENTVTVSRYNNAVKLKFSYDYHLFDRLFLANTSGKYHVRIYFTSYFLCFVVSRDNSAYYISPLFVGLDYNKRYPDATSTMYKFINRDKFAVITLGRSDGASDYISNVKIYSTTYSDPSAQSDWRRLMQQNFSSAIK